MKPILNIKDVSGNLIIRTTEGEEVYATSSTEAQTAYDQFVNDEKDTIFFQYITKMGKLQASCAIAKEYVMKVEFQLWTPHIVETFQKYIVTQLQ